jgi:hypothetical protein
VSEVVREEKKKVGGFASLFSKKKKEVVSFSFSLPYPSIDSLLTSLVGCCYLRWLERGDSN